MVVLASQPSPRQAALKGVKWRFLAAPIEKGQLTEGQTPWTDEARRDHFATLQDPTGRHYMVGDQISYHPGWQEGAIQSAYHALRDIERRERDA